MASRSNQSKCTPMHLKIYFGNKPLFLCNSIDETVNEYLHHDDAMFIDELSTRAVNSMIYEMQLEKIHAGIYYHEDLAALYHAFEKKCRLVKAGGGVVANENGALLLMKRRGKWDLPKGKLDPGEDIETCALREIKEETGLAKVTIEAPLPISYHTYPEGKKLVLKETHWFAMKAAPQQKLQPQAEEDIEELVWVLPGQLQPYLQNTYPSVTDTLEAYDRLDG
jgi:8-oxo-dGTP pyrophosphatase MutT (NUDIX family)